MRRIRILIGDVAAMAVLNDTKTASAIWKALPLRFTVDTWGDELYGTIPLKLSPEAAREVVERGDLGYWPPGQAFCIFFGPTPASRGDEVRAASPVNVFGQVEGDPTVFRKVRDGATVVVEVAR
ncbi:MAG: hypothetical protein IT330_19335 [Anaerolineae bacterium]|nr:hypothetical protein [Anaerolineae bacterium]